MAESSFPPSTRYAGGDLIYQVTLTNGTSTGIDLIGNCPNFGQDLFLGDLSGSPPRGIKPLYQLNCKPAGDAARRELDL